MATIGTTRQVWFILLLVFSGAAGRWPPGPSFVGTIGNNTVTLGSDAVLSCQVQNLGYFKVAWVKVEPQTILTIHNLVISFNPRVDLSHEDQSIYRLHLKDVVESDRGFYMCMINTDPMINQMGYLQIIGAAGRWPPGPSFVGTIGNNTVTLGSDAVLSCQVQNLGYFKVTWVKVEPHTTLTIHHFVISRRIRVGVIYEDQPIYRLHLKDVVESDRGFYMCQINTDPMINQMGYLQIIDENPSMKDGASEDGSMNSEDPMGERES